MKLWHALSGNLLGQAPSLEAEPALQFSGDDTRIAISPYNDAIVGTVRLQGNDCVRNVYPSRETDTGYDHTVLDISPDGRLFAAAGSNGILLGDLHHGRELACWPLDADNRNHTSLQFTADGGGLVVCSAKSGQWFRALTWEDSTHLIWGPPRLLNDAPDWMLGSPRIPGGRGTFLNVNEDEVSDEVSVRPVDAPGSTDDPKTHLKWDRAVEGRFHQAILSRDGRYLATSVSGLANASNPGCRVWDAATGRLVRDCGQGLGSSVTFSPGGKYLYASAKRNVVFETEHWREIFEVPYDTTRGAFSPDESILAVRVESMHDGNAGTIRLFAMPGGEPLAVLETASIEMMFSADGHYLLTWGDMAPVQIWDLPAIRRELRFLGLVWSNEPIPEPTPEFPPITIREGGP